MKAARCWIALSAALAACSYACSQKQGGVSPDGASTASGGSSPGSGGGNAGSTGTGSGGGSPGGNGSAATTGTGGNAGLPDAAAIDAGPIPYFMNWPAGSSPQEIGKRVAENYLARAFPTSAVTYQEA